MKRKTNKEVRRYLTMLLSLLLSAILFNLLILKANIVCGGVNGIAIIINHIYKIKPSIIIFVISVLLLIFSLFFLGLKRTSGTIVATITSYISRGNIILNTVCKNRYKWFVFNIDIHRSNWRSIKWLNVQNRF